MADIEPILKRMQTAKGTTPPAECFTELYELGEDGITALKDAISGEYLPQAVWGLAFIALQTGDFSPIQWLEQIDNPAIRGMCRKILKEITKVLAKNVRH